MSTNTITAPQFESFRALVSHAETLHAELSTLNVATRHLEDIQTRIGNCRDEDEAHQLLAEMHAAEEIVVIKQIRGRRLTADLESVLVDADAARHEAKSEAAAILRQTPQEVTRAVNELVETCRHETGTTRDPRSLGDVIQSFVPMVLTNQLQQHLQSANRLYYREEESHSNRLEVLKESVAWLQHLHDGRNELAAETARLTAASPPPAPHSAKPTTNAEPPCTRKQTTPSRRSANPSKGSHPSPAFWKRWPSPSPAPTSFPA